MLISAAHTETYPTYALHGCLPEPQAGLDRECEDILRTLCGHIFDSGMAYSTYSAQSANMLLATPAGACGNPTAYTYHCFKSVNSDDVPGMNHAIENLGILL